MTQEETNKPRLLTKISWSIKPQAVCHEPFMNVVQLVMNNLCELPVGSGITKERIRNGIHKRKI